MIFLGGVNLFFVIFVIFLFFLAIAAKCFFETVTNSVCYLRHNAMQGSRLTIGGVAKFLISKWLCQNWFSVWPFGPR